MSQSMSLRVQYIWFIRCWNEFCQKIMTASSGQCIAVVRGAQSVNSPQPPNSVHSLTKGWVPSWSTPALLKDLAYQKMSWDVKGVGCLLKKKIFY